jgi:hypothetical protein
VWSGGTSRYTQLSLFVCAVADRSDYLIVITELQKLCAASNIDESTIAVRGSSHIGGHQYAGRYIFSLSSRPSLLINNSYNACIMDDVLKQAH